MSEKLKSLQFNLDFFKKLGVFSKNRNLLQYLPTAGTVISAQKILLMPTFDAIPNIVNTSIKLQESQNRDKSLKEPYSASITSISYVLDECKMLLGNLLAERNEVRNKFCDNIQRGTNKDYELPKNNLDNVIKIWNSLIQHRILEVESGITFTLKMKTNLSVNYPAYQMSDGEKVALYLIAYVLQSPKDGFVIVDEPEMYLHKTILNKLWDILEDERKDCIFIYLTHDLGFATSRALAKKVWIKSFSVPDKWEIEYIKGNELPEELLMELLGSRKNILFCEGKKGGIDEQIYNILFPDFTIIPVESCFSVINYTKAFNKMPNLTTKAIGLIDSDHHGADRLEKLKSNDIFSFSIAEIENLFFDESFLKLLSEKLLVQDKNAVESIKSEVTLQLEKEMELQISNYISMKINYYFTDSHLTKGNNLKEVEKNYVRFKKEIKICAWTEHRKVELEKIIKDKDYKRVLSIFNNKGLKQIATKHFGVSDFTDRAIDYLKNNLKAQDAIKKYFPVEIWNRIELNKL
ncbi:ABC transporter ATPase component-like protein [Candidatus Endomicrobiellum trichonymphae]|uniref:ABC transporter ATPase component-like protein n=2 Tax=Endomicrobium trichonymphae TaxID=1408204 RepID=B1H040_ENDTX|nr:ABC transporter ATPase component-like protein [Candidatus Endomicrobium trichonymphae]